MICFGIIIVINIISLILHGNIFLFPDGYDDTIMVLTFIIPYVISVIVFLIRNNVPMTHETNRIFQHTQSKEQDKCFAGIIGRRDDEYDQACILQRTKQVEEIYKLIKKNFVDEKQSKRKYLVITGDSGAGKSTLLYFLSKKLTKNGLDCEIKRENYNNLVIRTNSKKKKVFLLDQFEKALKYNEYIDIIKDSLNNENVYFVFVFPQEYMNQIKTKLSFLDIKCNIYTLVVDDFDFYCLKEKIKLFCDFENEEFERYYNGEQGLNNIKAKILCNVLKQVKNGELPLVEFELIGEILESGMNDVIDEEKALSSHAMDMYLNSWIERFPNKEAAYSILYLLSDNRIYSINDLAFITFEDKACFSLQGECSVEGLNIVDAISNNFLIDSFTQNGTKNFRVKHGYIARQIQNYCSKREFDSDILKNVDYYRHRTGTEMESTEYIAKLKERFDRYTNKYSRNPLYICAIVLFLVLFVINIWQFQDSDVYIHLIYIFTSIACMPALYYIYNYCNTIFRLFPFYKYAATPILGCTVIVCAYVFYQYWGIFMGAEIVILSINIYFLLKRNTAYIAKNKYRNDAVVFFIIGVSIMLLGFLYAKTYNAIITDELSLAWNSVYIWLLLSYYLLFTIYAVLSVISHIKHQYVFVHIGYTNMDKAITEINI